MTPTKEQIEQAREWLGNLTVSVPAPNETYVTLNNIITQIVAAYAAHCTAEKDAEITRLRIELGYYADENRWRSSEVFMCGHSGPSAAVRDGGRRARAALQEPTP